MRYKGISKFGPNTETLVLPGKADGADMVIEVVAVVNFDKFEELVPKPIIKYVTKATGEKYTEVDKESEAKYSELRFHFLVLQSLKATPDLVFDTVDDSKPETWANWQAELKEANFSPGEVNKIIDTILVAQSLNDEKIEKATADFLLMKKAGQVM